MIRTHREDQGRYKIVISQQRERRDYHHNNFYSINILSNRIIYIIRLLILWDSVEYRTYWGAVDRDSSKNRLNARKQIQLHLSNTAVSLQKNNNLDFFSRGFNHYSIALYFN